MQVIANIPICFFFYNKRNVLVQGSRIRRTIYRTFEFLHAKPAVLNHNLHPQLDKLCQNLNFKHSRGNSRTSRFDVQVCSESVQSRSEVWPSVCLLVRVGFNQHWSDAAAPQPA